MSHDESIEPAQAPWPGITRSHSRRVDLARGCFLGDLYSVASLFRPLRPELALLAALASPAAAQLTGPGAVTQPAPFLEDFELRRAPAVVTTGPALASSEIGRAHV